MKWIVKEGLINTLASMGVLSPFLYMILYLRFRVVEVGCLDWFNAFKGVLECAYYIAGLAIFVVIVLAYKQYVYEKMKFARGEKEYAHELYIRYVDIINETDRKFTPDVLKKIISGEDRMSMHCFIHHINSIEAISAAFVDGLADPNTGRKLLGDAFCMQVCRYVPVMKRIWGEDYKQGCSNMFELYEMWKV